MSRGASRLTPSSPAELSNASQGELSVSTSDSKPRRHPRNNALSFTHFSSGVKWPKASAWANQRPGQTAAVPSPSGGHEAGLWRGGAARRVQQLLCYRCALSAAVTPTNFTCLSLASPASGPDYSGKLYECDNGCLTYAAPLIRLTPPVAALFTDESGGESKREEGMPRRGNREGGGKLGWQRGKWWQARGE